MELKFVMGFTTSKPIDCSNRTFMELKFAKSGIVSPNPFCSNRTFMELKLRWLMQGTRQFRVLIVPLWN